jgi:acyl-CoA synthetase (AMP-forming)/AMP-acid ligase II
MFERIITNHSISEEVSKNIITDGGISCTYAELPGIFEKLDDFFDRSDFRENDCVVLRCGNTLREAILLLWMLSRKRNFLLLPRAGEGKEQRRLEELNLPAFCRYTVSLRPGLKTEDGSIGKPGFYIDIRPNVNYEKFPDDLYGGSVFLRTSGSTAEPKLVHYSNETLYRNADNCVGRFQLVQGDRVMLPVPIYHMYGLGAAILPGVIAGVSLYLMEGTNIIKYLDGEKRFKPNVSYMTPTLCQMSLRARKSDYAYRLVVTAGDRINNGTFRDFEKRFGKLVNLYGSTELGAIATSNPAMPVETRSEGIVEAMPGVAVGLKAEGEDISEIRCKHGTGFDTYVDKKGVRTGGLADGWFMTKDLGRILSQGTFKVIGRTGNSINRNGILVAFAEVESLMEQGIEEVQFAVVLAKDVETVRGMQLIACCELKPGAAVDGNFVRSRCFDVMMRHMVPDEVMIINEMPRLPNGKFDRKKLEELIKQ